MQQQHPDQWKSEGYAESERDYKEPNPNISLALWSSFGRVTARCAPTPTSFDFCSASARKENLKHFQQQQRQQQSETVYQPGAERGRRAKVNGPQEVSGERTTLPLSPCLTEPSWALALKRRSEWEPRPTLCLLPRLSPPPRDKWDSDGCHGKNSPPPRSGG